MAKTAQEKGYDWEATLREVLVDLLEYHRASFHRFYDTKSTGGGILPSQPADFLLIKAGFPLLIECKHSEVETTLSRKYLTSSVDTDQCARMRVWIRSGAGGIFLFKSDLSDTVEIWPGSHIIEVRNTPRMQPDPFKVLYQFPTSKKLLKEALLTIMENPSCAKT
jgi:hypothetical protein